MRSHLCFQEACQLYERVGYHDFEGIVLDGSEKKRLVKSLGKANHTLVLRNHGLITAGPSAIWAFARHQVFVRNAEVQLRAMSSGGKIIKIPKYRLNSFGDAIINTHRKMSIFFSKQIVVRHHANYFVGSYFASVIIFNFVYS